MFFYSVRVKFHQMLSHSVHQECIINDSAYVGSFVENIHKFGSVAKEVLCFINLLNLNEYSRHSLRCRLIKLFVEGGPDFTCLETHGQWMSTTVVEGYNKDSLRNQTDSALIILFPRKSDVYDTSKNIPILRVHIEYRRVW